MIASFLRGFASREKALHLFIGFRGLVDSHDRICKSLTPLHQVIRSHRPARVRAVLRQKNAIYTATIGCGCVVNTRGITLGIKFCLCSNTPPVHVQDIDIRRAQFLEGCLDGDLEGLCVVPRVIHLVGVFILASLKIG
jgi:hypothetical protein